MTQAISEQTTITLKKEDLKLNHIADKYYADLSLKDLIILKAELKNAEPFVKYPMAEELKRCSVIDFSQNLSGKPKYNSSWAVFGNSLNGTIENTTTYDESLGYWVTTGTNNNFMDMKPYSKNDFFALWENIYDGFSRGGIWYTDDDGVETRHIDTYIPGLMKFFLNINQGSPFIGIRPLDGAKQKFIVAGFSQPINMVLYNYMNKPENTDGYVDPANDFNRVALRKVTTEACNKLKSEGTRIYVIKYRVQDKHSELQRTSYTGYSTSSRNHDYEAVEGCASGTDYLKEAENSTQLQEILSEIAADIKDWADYEPAKLIE